MTVAPAFNPRRTIPVGMTFEDWYATDGWPLRRFAWPQADGARGSLLFLGGRGDFVEKYLDALTHWQAQGWDLAGFDWRGQGGSGRLLADPLICHQIDFDPLLEDLAHFAAHWIAATPAPHVIVAHSMGANLALRLLDRDPAIVDGIILSSPMIAIRVRYMPGWMLRWIAHAAVTLGFGERKIWRRDIGDVGGRMTSCPERRADKAWWKEAHPRIASGAPSWGWLHAACASIARLPRRRLAAIRTPILLVTAAYDPIIDPAAVARAATILPNAELVVLEGGGHELLRETDARRLPLLVRIDQFLDAVPLPDGLIAAPS